MLNDAPADRYCDIVMKGGITSGVVYPPAICKLAERYRFKSIGGTSAGAIAAAVTAAAEFRRRKQKSMAGFELLEQLPPHLGRCDRTGRTQLFRLFQPEAPCRRLFLVLAASLNATGTYHRIFKILVGCVRSYWVAALLSAVVSVAIGLATHSIHAGVLVLLLTLPLFVGLSIYRDVTRRVVANNYGLCKGMTNDRSAGPALTEWLHLLIQQAAGLPMNEPLTFGDLWNADRDPRAAHAATDSGRSIDLRVFTTNLAHGRPYVFPHAEPTARLFFSPADLQPYLPADVMNAITNKAVAYEPGPLSPDSDPPVQRAQANGLFEIPRPEDLPILLAVRMSLSFPLLFSAVPLWAIDYQQPHVTRGFKRCMFSDGGISSNFPMHLFDGLIPRWPTFGIDLDTEESNSREPQKGADDQIQADDARSVFLPHAYLEGIADRWTRFDEKLNPASRLGGFLMSISSTMQNWNDNTETRSAGVRDRVVRVSLRKDEGGMNLNMPGRVIKDVAKRGALAADALINRYLDRSPANGWDGWSSQRWVRLDVFIYSLRQKIAGMAAALGVDVAHSQSYAALITHAQTAAPPGHAKPLTSQQAAALRDLITALNAAVAAFGLPTEPYHPDDPLPEPELRAKSPL